MNRPRYVEICTIAYDLWHEFVPTCPYPEQIFDAGIATSDPPNRVAKAFFRFCALKVVPSPRRIAVQPHIVYKDLSQALSGSPAAGRASSWLWRRNTIPYIVIDNDYLLAGVSAREYKRTVTRLILHETGHIALHWDKLTSKGDGLANRAPTEFEEEAWLFCEIIVGLALGYRVLKIAAAGLHDDSHRFA